MEQGPFCGTNGTLFPTSDDSAHGFQSQGEFIITCALLMPAHNDLVGEGQTVGTLRVFHPTLIENAVIVNVSIFGGKGSRQVFFIFKNNYINIEHWTKQILHQY